MARDRQRAKHAAKRQPGAGGPAAGSASTDARDIGLDQAEADDAGLGNTTPPEPTKHGMPHVEEAHMAEAGPVDFDDGGTAHDDEVEGDLVPAARPGAAERAAHGRRTSAAAASSASSATASTSSSASSGRTAGRSARARPSRSGSPFLQAATSDCSTRSGSPSSKPLSKPKAPLSEMFRWYVINTYSGHENKVKQNLEHRVVSLSQQRAVRQVVVPTETVQEMKDNQKVSVEKRTMPGYVLVNMDLNEDSWSLVKGTPGVTGFVGASNEPIPLTQSEVDRLLHREVAVRAPSRAQFSIGESVKVISGPLSDFSGEISEINEDASKLKVLVSIFGRETPVEVGYDQVKKI